jgi:diguanylate cyclase
MIVDAALLAHRYRKRLAVSSITDGMHHASANPAADPVVDLPSPAGELRQGLRLRRFLLASAFSALYLVVLAVFYAQDRIDRQTLLEAYATVAAFILVFFGIFRLGLNLRFPDPSLTGWQFLASVFTMLYVVYRAPDTRLVFTAFFFVALMFGMLRDSGRKLAVLGAISLLAFAMVIWLRYASNRDDEVLRLDLLQFGVLLVTTPWFLLIGEHVKRLRRGLTEASIKLEGIEENARRDDLTGVYNRRALMIAMEDAKRWADETREPLSICMIDLDRFKRYNDEFDHLTGDQVLRAFAQAAQGGLRATDVFGRYGGEEFVQVLRHSTLAGAMADAERLRERISQLDLPIARSTRRLTVSIGVAQYKPGETIIQTFARADEALYRAKQRGRNRVECEDGAATSLPSARSDNLAGASTLPPLRDRASGRRIRR